MADIAVDRAQAKAGRTIRAVTVAEMLADQSIKLVVGAPRAADACCGRDGVLKAGKHTYLRSLLHCPHGGQKILARARASG